MADAPKLVQLDGGPTLNVVLGTLMPVDLLAGNNVTSTCAITDTSGAPVDSDTIQAQHLDTFTGTVTSLTVVHDSTGHYHATATLVSVGVHVVKWSGGSVFPFVAQHDYAALAPAF